MKIKTKIKCKSLWESQTVDFDYHPKCLKKSKEEKIWKEIRTLCT